MSPSSPLRVHCTIGVRIAMEELAPRFEALSGRALDLVWGTAPMLVRRLQGGETTDVMILNAAGIETMRDAGRIVAGSDVTIASSGVAIAVRAGASHPDISTSAALKRTLLAARAISYTDPAAGGASGIHFAKLLESMGIAAEVNAKNTYPPPGGYSAELLLNGAADLAVQQEPELRAVAGTEIVGPLPGDLNVTTVFRGAIATGCADAVTAAGLLRFLRDPAQVALFRAKGLT